MATLASIEQVVQSGGDPAEQIVLIRQMLELEREVIGEAVAEMEEQAA
jgi:hypothetical protein